MTDGNASMGRGRVRTAGLDGHLGDAAICETCPRRLDEAINAWWAQVADFTIRMAPVPVP